jgi:hypothetical protein
VDPVFHAIPTATDPASLQSMRCARLGSAVGATTGCSISTCRPICTPLHTAPQLMKSNRTDQLVSVLP